MDNDKFQERVVELCAIVPRIERKVDRLIMKVEHLEYSRAYLLGAASVVGAMAGAAVSWLLP